MRIKRGGNRTESREMEEAQREEREKAKEDRWRKREKGESEPGS